MAETLVLRGVLKGHAGWVTAIACPLDNPDLILSSSRDKSIIVWQLIKEEGNYGVAKRRLTGHAHFVQDVVISSDGQFALSGSWDGTLRLWDLNSGTTTRRFVGHTKDLSTNELSGHIPLELASSLTSLKLLNLSYNFLSGPIPQGSGFSGFGPFSFEGNPELCGHPLPQCSGAFTSQSECLLVLSSLHVAERPTDF